jgi:hypothetical protein
MSVNFQIKVKRSNGDLYVSPKGDFDAGSAWELINLLVDQYDGKGQIFIDTHNLRQICPFGCSTFRGRLSQTKLPSHRLSFTGEKGYEIAPEGSSVFIEPEKHRCRCRGNCVDCQCANNQPKPKPNYG